MKARTIRRRFRRRMRLALFLCVAGALVTAWSVKYGDFHVSSPGPLLPRLVSLLGMIVFCLGLVISGTGRCPRCLSVVGPLIVLYRPRPPARKGNDRPARVYS